MRQASSTSPKTCRKRHQPRHEQRRTAQRRLQGISKGGDKTDRTCQRQRLRVLFFSRRQFDDSPSQLGKCRAKKKKRTPAQNLKESWIEKMVFQDKPLQLVGGLPSPRFASFGLRSWTKKIGLRKREPKASTDSVEWGTQPLGTARTWLCLF